MENGNQKNSTFWRGMFIGAVVGSAVTMLSTPRTGAEMRTIVREKAGKTKDYTGDMVHRTKGKVDEWRHKSGTKAEEMQSAEERES